MSNLRCWLLPSVFLSALVTSAVARGANEEKKIETEKSTKADRHFADMLRFSGKQHIVIPKLHYDGSHPITFEAIVMTLYRGSIIGDFNGSGLGLSVADGFCKFHVNDGRATDNGYVSIKSDIRIRYRVSTGREKPVHIAGVLDGKELRLYVAGKLQGSATIGKFNKSIHPFMIGADPGGNSEPTQFLIGIIDEVRVSKMARYQKDFAPPSKFESDEYTMVLYRFAERDGDFVADASGNARHGKIVLAPNATITTDSPTSDLRRRIERLEKEVEQLKAHLDIGSARRNPQQPAIDRLRELAAKVSVKDGKVIAVNLTNSSISDSDMELLSSLTTLERLTLNGCSNLTDAGLVYLKSLSGLKGLALERTNITDGGLENVKGLTQLSLISLNATRVGDAGLKHLAGLKKMGTLYLSATRTTDAGVTSLKNMKQLSWLDLSQTQVTDAGLKHLSGLSHLRLLSLYGIPMTDAGIAPLAKLSNLVQLTLNQTQVTDAGLLQLAELPKLHELNLRGTRVTELGVQQIKKALPDCRIDYQKTNTVPTLPES